MNNVRLICGSQAVDLPTDFGILINKSIADIRTPEQRSSDWTKTFTLPGTKANNKLFSHLFDLDLNVRNTTSANFAPDFNPNLKAPAILYVDEVSQIEGFIRLLEIKVTDRNEIVYECSMHGQLADLFATIADAKLADLDFTEYNHTINSTNIFDSWDTQIQLSGSPYVNFSGGAPTGVGYVYGWIDNGEYANYTQMYTDDMSVYLYAKTIVDKIFTNTGYRYSTGSFFNSAQFKRLVVPCPTRVPLLSESQALLRQFEATRTTDATFTAGQKITFPNEVTDPSSQYNAGTSVLTNAFSSQTYDFYFLNKATITSVVSSVRVIYGYYFNGSLIFTFSNTTPVVAGTATFNTLNRQQLKLPLGDLELRVIGFQDADTNAVIGGTYTQKTDSAFYNAVVNSARGYGDSMDFTGFFSDETKQRDFLKWLFTMFNLYVEADPDNLKQLTILPREDFYTTTTRDWTAKRDLSQSLDLIPMGELEANRYRFTYTEGEDIGNKEYKQDFDRIYGDRIVTVENDFMKDEKKIEVGFAPTLIYTYADKSFPFIDNGTNNTNKNSTGKLRLLQYKSKTCATYTVRYGLSTGFSGTTTKTLYPYMGHLDDPTASTTDINFGMPRRVNLPAGTAYTNSNLYNVYWSKYIGEITNKNSKIVRGAFYLNPVDMEQLSFRDLYYFDNNYFRLNKVEDYDPVNPSVNICEFLLLNQGASFAASGGTIGSGGSTEQEYDPIGGGTNGKVIQNKGVSVGYYNRIGDGIGVGDAISNDGRANTAIGTNGTSFLPNSERSVVIGKGVQNVASDEVWLQGAKVTENNVNTNRTTEITGTTHTATLSEDILIIKTANGVTIDLPTAASAINKIYRIFKTSSSGYQFTLNPNGSEEVNETATYSSNTQYAWTTLYCDGVEWWASTT